MAKKTVWLVVYYTKRGAMQPVASYDSSSRAHEKQREYNSTLNPNSTDTYGIVSIPHYEEE